MLDTAEEGVGAFGHAEAVGPRPRCDLALGEVDPVDDQLEELDLERGEEHGEMGSLRERMSTVEIAGVDRDDLFVHLGGIGGHLIERSREVIDAAVLGEQQPQQRLGFEHGGLWCRGHPHGEGGSARVGDGVHGAIALAHRLVVGGRQAVFDELLRLGVQQSLRLRPREAQAPSCLLGEFIAGPRPDCQQTQDRIGGRGEA